MRLGMALACALVVGLTGPALATARPALAPVAVSHSSAAITSVDLAADTGDLFVSTAIDISIWLACRIMDFVDTLTGQVAESLRRARAHGDSTHPPLPTEPPMVVPVAKVVASPVPVTPSSGLTP